MLTRLAENRTKDLLDTNHAANQQGLFYSGQLGKRRDDVEKAYQQQQDDARTSYDRDQAARRTALEGIGALAADPNSPLGYTGTGQAGIDLGALFGDAVTRRAANNAAGPADAAAATSLAPPSAVAPTATPAPRPIKIAASTAHGGRKWVYEQGASGKWIPIRPA